MRDIVKTCLHCINTIVSSDGGQSWCHVNPREIVCPGMRTVATPDVGRTHIVERDEDSPPEYGVGDPMKGRVSGL